MINYIIECRLLHPSQPAGAHSLGPAAGNAGPAPHRPAGRPLLSGRIDYGNKAVHRRPWLRLLAVEHVQLSSDSTFLYGWLWSLISDSHQFLWRIRLLCIVGEREETLVEKRGSSSYMK